MVLTLNNNYCFRRNNTDDSLLNAKSQPEVVSDSPNSHGGGKLCWLLWNESNNRIGAETGRQLTYVRYVLSEGHIQYHHNRKTNQSAQRSQVRVFI